MTIKIEVGFTEAGNSAPFLTLDDPAKGKLNSPNFVLGGAEVLVDISQDFQSYQIQRGKTRELDKFNAGQVSVRFENSNRFFDPTFEASPFFGQIVPKRQIRITNNDVIQFEGTIDDWNIEFSAGGQSIAIAQAFDGFSLLANIELDEVAVPQESSAERIDRILDIIGWASSKRDLDPGGATLGAETISNGTNVLQYLTKIGLSEPGDVFISKNGSVKFVSRNVSFQSDGLTFSDTGTDINFTDVNVVFGSELLFNQATVSSPAGSVQRSDAASIGEYGERDINRETLLSDTDQLDTLAKFIVNRFAEPELRFESIQVDVRNLSSSQKLDMIGLELGDVVELQLTPNEIPPAIEAYGKIIGISTVIGPAEEKTALNFQSLAGALFVLNDTVFGRLDSSNSLGW